MTDIRKIPDVLAHDRMVLFGKIRSECRSLDLLDIDQFGLFATVTATLLEPAGNSYGIHFGGQYFVEDENYEEEILASED